MREYASFLLLATVGTSCATPRSDVVPGGASLAGRWELVTHQPRPGRAGLRLTITVDSTPGDTIYGRVTHFFSGNVGVEPDAFAPIRGIVGPGTVRLPVAWARDASLAMLLEGRVAGDSIGLEMVRLGPDSLDVTGWWLTRGRRP